MKNLINKSKLKNIENQGRSPHQQESNEKVMFTSCMGLLIVLCIIVIYGIVSNG